MTCDNCNYREQVGFDRGQESIAVQAVIQAAEHFAEILDLYDYLWQWGDGQGGWVSEVIEDVLLARGFQRYVPDPKKRTQKSRKPVSSGKVVIAMQNSSGACVACGATQRLEVDHIVPVSRGGTNDVDNLQILCKSCNASKRDKTMEEWLGDVR